MTYAFVSLLVYAVSITAVLIAAVVHLDRARSRLVARLGVIQGEAQAQAQERIERETARLHEFYAAALGAVGSTMQFGTPHPAPATVDAEPTAEQRLGRAIEEDMIARGMENLRREYEAAGIRVSEDELRDEVVSIITGQPIPIPASVRGLVDPVPSPA